MSSSPVSVACFKFKKEEEYDDWVDDCQNEVDGRGAMWQLQLQPSPLEERPGGITIGTDIVTGYFALTPSHGQPEGVERLVTAKVTLVVRNQLGDAVYEYDITSKVYDSSKGSYVEFDDFVKWSALKEMLIDGALILDAIVQYQEPKRKSFLPNNPFKGNMLKLLDCEEDKDVFFNVGGEIIGAHKLILKANSSVLATLCTGGSSRESPIHIKDTKPKVFRCILLYIYGGNCYNVLTGNNFVLKHGNGKEIIDACNRYDVVGLKLKTEAVLVHNCGGEEKINVENVAEWVQFADAKTCPLLKEFALSYFVARYGEVLKTQAYANLKQCPRLMEEVMTAVYNTTLYKDKRYGKPSKSLSVCELREELGRLGLNVDGSKEMLVARLDSAKVKEDDEDDEEE